MNVEIGTKAAQIPRKGIYINGIFGAVYRLRSGNISLHGGKLIFFYSIFWGCSAQTQTRIGLLYLRKSPEVVFRFPAFLKGAQA
jgi:hypothetical protein